MRSQWKPIMSADVLIFFLCSCVLIDVLILTDVLKLFSCGVLDRLLIFRNSRLRNSSCRNAETIAWHK